MPGVGRLVLAREHEDLHRRRVREQVGDQLEALVGAVRHRRQAQVDERTKLQLKFYARQFIDAMSPSNFPATNPEVIRTAIQPR